MEVAEGTSSDTNMDIELSGYGTQTVALALSALSLM